MRIRTKNNKNKTQDIHHTHKGIHKHIRHTHFFLVVAIILIIAGFLINLVVYKSFALNKKIEEEINKPAEYFIIPPSYPTSTLNPTSTIVILKNPNIIGLESGMLSNISPDYIINPSPNTNNIYLKYLSSTTKISLDFDTNRNDIVCVFDSNQYPKYAQPTNNHISYKYIENSSYKNQLNVYFQCGTSLYNLKNYNLQINQGNTDIKIKNPPIKTPVNPPTNPIQKGKYER